VIAIFAALIRCCCCRGRPVKGGVGAFKPGRGKSHSSRYATAAPMSQPSNGAWGGGGYYPPPPQQQQGYGGSYYAPPPGPPPTHPSSAYQGSFNHEPRNVLRR